MENDDPIEYTLCLAAQKRDPFLLSMGASAQCVRKAINGVKAAYGVDENVGLENETCVAP